MGKVLSSIKHPFRNFNLESRAHKVISQEKPARAPWHERDQAEVDRLMKEYPDVYQESLKKNQLLDEHLKQVYVTSTNPEIPTAKTQNPDRPLPADRTSAEPFLYGVKEPNVMPVGKASLKTVLEFISQHQNDPKVFTAKKIAEDTTIPENTIANILKYFKVFEVYIPIQREVKAKFAGPSRPKVQVIKQVKKQLPAGATPQLPSGAKDKT